MGGTQARLLFLGFSGSGKTALINRIRRVVDPSVPECTVFTPTVGRMVEEFIWMRRPLMTFQTWDVGGGGATRAQWPLWYDGINAIVWVIDSSNRRAISPKLGTSGAMVDKETVPQAMEKVLSDPKLAGLPVLVLANKQDLDHAATAREIQELLAAEVKGLQGREWAVFGTSASGRVRVVRSNGQRFRLHNQEITCRPGMDWLHEQLTIRLTKCPDCGGRDTGMVVSEDEEGSLRPNGVELDEEEKWESIGDSDGTGKPWQTKSAPTYIMPALLTTSSSGSDSPTSSSPTSLSSSPSSLSSSPSTSLSSSESTSSPSSISLPVVLAATVTTAALVVASA